MWCEKLGRNPNWRVVMASYLRIYYRKSSYVRHVFFGEHIRKSSIGQWIGYNLWNSLLADFVIFWLLRDKKWHKIMENHHRCSRKTSNYNTSLHAITNLNLQSQWLQSKVAFNVLKWRIRCKFLISKNHQINGIYRHIVKMIFLELKIVKITINR